jgi:hypothetical protein
MKCGPSNQSMAALNVDVSTQRAFSLIFGHQGSIFAFADSQEAVVAPDWHRQSP